MVKTLLLVLITFFLPPVGVFLVAGCGADFFINLLLTILGFLPGHIHAFYIEYVYVKRRDEIRAGIYDARPAPGVYSQKVQNGGHKTLPVAHAPAGTQTQQGYDHEQQQGYGTLHYL